MRNRILLGLAVLVAAACAREVAPETALKERRAPKAGESVQITVTLPQIDVIETRVLLAAGSQGALLPSWQTEDAILVGDQVFDFVSGNGQTATFKGTAPAGKKFDITYPASASGGDGNLIQSASNDFSHLRYSATLKGVDSFENVHFSYGWAAEHGGTFSQMGALQLVLNLPATATAISMVKLECEGADPCIQLVDNVVPTDGSFTAWLRFPMEKMEFAPDKEVTITVTTEAGEFNNVFYPAPQTLYGGHVVKLVTAKAKWNRVLSGKGSESDPYLIATAEDFNNVRNLISEGTQTWFRQTADIDLTEVTNWQPINLQNAPYGIGYDGDGHKISHFRCTGSTWASIFGVLHGEVQNLIIEDSEVVTTGTSPVGLVAAWAGNTDGSLQGKMTNVHVVRGKVSNNDYTYIGGLSGRACASTFTNCSFDGTVERTGVKDYTSSYYPVGGILGQALDGVAITGCSTSGSLTTASGRAAGGIVGLCSVSLDITACTSTMTITANDDVAGGIVGYYGTGTISGCKVEADISVTGTRGSTSYVGGIAGHSAGSSTITRCSYKGALSGTGGIVAGILGQSNASSGTGMVISECFSSGSVKGTQLLGGIAGRATNQGLTLSDCGTTMDITGTGSYNGGVLGDAPQNTTVSRCYATGTVKGVYALGGVVGRAYGRQGSSNSLDTDVNTTVEYCIAFNPLIKTTTAAGETPTNHYSGGAVIGCSSRPNTLRGCRRSADLVLEFYADASLNVLFDHEDSSPSSPLTQPSGSAKWFSPYHGKAAAAGATVSSVARDLGWNTAIWDLSADLPVLKNLK